MGFFLEKIINACIALLGIYVIVGWITGNEMMVRVVPGSVAMGLNTANLFIISAICLYSSSYKNRSSAILHNICIAILIALPCCILYEHYYDINLGIDWTSLHSTVNDGNPRPGRTSPNACVAFILIGISFILFEIKNTSVLLKYIETVLACIILSIGVLAIIGFVLELDALYKVAHFNYVAIPTAAGMTLVGICLLNKISEKYYSQSTLERDDKRIIRSAAVVLTIIAIVSGLLGFAILKRVVQEAMSEIFLHVTKMQGNIIAETIDSRVLIARIIATRPSLQSYLDKYNQKSNITDTSTLLSDLNLYLLAFDVAGIAVMGPQGNPISTSGTLVDGKAEVSLPLKVPNLHASLLWNNGFILQIKQQVIRDGRLLGLIIVEQALPVLSSMLFEATKNNASTDVLLCARIKDDAVCYPSRFYKANLHIPMYKDGKPYLAISRALLGETGIMHVKDLRGINVLAGYTPIANTGLGIVLKSDITDLFNIIRLRLNLLVALLTLLVIAGTFILRAKVQPLASKVFSEKERLRVTLNSIADAVISTNIQGIVTYLNPIAEIITGYNNKEATGKLINSIVNTSNGPTSPISVNAIDSISKNSTNTESDFDLQKVESVERTLIRKDDKHIPIRLTITQLSDEKGQISGYLYVIEDITERKQHELALTTTADQLRLLIQNTPAAVAMFDNNLKYLMASYRWFIDYNIQDKEIMGKSHYDIFPEIKTNSKWLEIHQRALKGETFNLREDSWFRENNKKEWLNWAIHPWYTSDGSIGGIIMFTEIITERKLAEEKLRKSEETFRTAMESSSIGFALVKPNGEWLEVNSALCEITGYSKSQLLSSTFQAITHPDDLALDLGYLEKLLSNEIKKYQIEKRYFHANGNIIWILLDVSLVRNASGEPAYLIAQIQDITNKKEIERLKNEFVSIISHELRTPVTAIRGSLGIIQGVYTKDCPPKVSSLIKIGMDNCDRLVLLINDLLDIDKMAAGEMHFDMKKMSIGAVTRKALSALEGYAHSFNVRIDYQPPTKTIHVNIDQDRYIQAISNLISNAIKYSTMGQVVKVRIILLKGHVRILIEDHGSGIPDEFKNRIFDKFSQADSALTRSKGGTGLGLHITKRIIESMHGTIDFESNPESGTTFWLELPIENLPA